MITGDMFAPVVPRFAQSHRVIVPDLRGHGRSHEMPPPYTSCQLADDLAELLDYCGIASADVLGYSNGGAVAQQLALDHPERCRRLVLACTYSHNERSVRERLEARVVPLLIRVKDVKRFARLALAQGLKHLENDETEWVNEIVDSISLQNASLMVRAWKDALVFDSRDWLSEIACPTLVVAGAADKGVPLEQALMLHDGIIGSRLITVEDADHALIWSHSEELVRITNAFLA